MSIHNSRQIDDVKIMLKTGVDGAGITNIEKTGTDGIVDTYTCTLSDGRKYTFTVTNGQGIRSIEKTGSQGIVDTYTITFLDGTTQDYTITNGNGIESIEKTDTQGLVDTYTITFDDGSTQDYTVTNGRDGGMSAYIVITGDAGATITVTSPSGSSLPVTQVSGSSTQWECETIEFGTHTVTSVLDEQTMTKTLNVDACKVYAVNVEQFSATITVTYPSGATCTCVGGSESYTATNNPETFTVHSASTFTITATDGTATDSETVTITTIGQSETVTLSFIPDGSTVTPTGDIQTWLHCADIWDKNYITIAQVLADSTTLSALIADSNAVDYMVRSATWATDVCADQTAMSYIGLDDNCADSLLADSTWRTTICNSTYFESVLNVKVPTMTSNTAPSGEAKASSSFSGTGSEYYPFKAFDKNTSTRWLSQTVYSSTVSYIQYMFTDKVVINKVHVQFDTWNTGSISTISSLKVKGSNDGTTFTNIATLSLTSKTQDFVFANNIGYKYIRLEITGYNAISTSQSVPSNVSIDELQFYGRTA